ncbi:hypothetical protein [Embleya sp. NPDC005971]|uniref:hypothetical protein n=1 Tax=Embleya sp. NPDC005971 TaxID=3156724 RepID=UPI0033FCDC4F
MSRVYFHSPSGEAELYGTERAWCAGLVEHIALGALNTRFNREHLTTLLPTGHYLHNVATRSWESSYATAFAVGDDAVEYEGHPISTFSLALNTAIALGNEQVRLAARIHGQCELHAWVDGPNRAWLAEIVQGGLEADLYRPGAGWEDVAGLLLARNDEPVVMSFSVSDSFPNLYIAGWEPPPERAEDDDAGEAWYDLPDEEQWAAAMRGLRAQKGHLEVLPENPRAWRFGHGLSVLDIVAPDWEQRIRKALRLDEQEGTR